MRISDWSSDVCSSDLVHQWFAMAANLSGDDGPVQSADIEQLIDQAPDWDKRVSEAWDKLKAGDIPRYVAAKLLRRPSLELLLPPMLANRDEQIGRASCRERVCQYV